MTGLSNYAENELLDHVLGGADYSRPATLYLKLYSAAPDFETGSGGTEITLPSDWTITNNSTNFPAASGRSKSNGVVLNGPTPSTDLGVAVAFGLWDAASSGNFLGGNTFTVSKTLKANRPIFIKAGEMVLSFSAGDFSNYLANALLDHILGGGNYTRPATMHLAMFSTNPNFATGTGGTELSGSGYARTAITNNSTNFPAASGGSKSNGADITHFTPSGSFSVVGTALYDASSSGNLLFGKALAATEVIESGDPVTTATGELSFTLS